MDIVMGMALAGAAGWNAFIPLLALAFAHRLSDRIPIGSSYTFLSSNGGLLILLLLMPLELFGDKSPGWDARNDRLGLIYRPIAGALIMLATTQGTGLLGILAALIGAALALGMHALKIRYRHPLSSLLGGLPTPVASAGEDFVVIVVCFAALVWPIVGLILLVLAALLAGWLGGVVQRKARRDTAETTTLAAPPP